REKRRWAERNGDLSNPGSIEEQRPESVEQPVALRQVARPPATTTQNNQSLLEQEILSDDRSHATGATQSCGDDGHVQQREQQILHARVNVGQTFGSAQPCVTLDSASKLAIRDQQVFIISSAPAAPCPLT